MQENKVEEKSTDSSKEKDTGMAIIAYFLFFVPLLTESKDDPFVKFHVKQSLLLILAMLALGVVSSIPFIGWILSVIIVPVGGCLVFVLWVIGLLNAINGKTEYVPLIGKYAEKWLTF